ncbi:nucleoside hydrolase [Pleomorphovibrio marinus]|uniref:nucleoside hydrolase n=1 Tax=Pleomorphovibrio marinus TaxID=2164132 RepID=UPI000E0BD0E8|nr:nucleoside hydrolase [Pleomorphovibrio marinus]
MSTLPFKTFFLLLLFSSSVVAQTQKVWLDADTGNEMDDLYAIARVLKDETIDLRGLSSAHFNNPDLLVFEKWNAYDTEGLVTIEDSQRLNEEMLEIMGMTDLPHPIGADRQIGRAWGGREPRDSPAAQAIIQEVNELGNDEKLDILTLGALTNVASAILLEPSILPKIRVYSLGARYFLDRKAWSKNEFNIRNDLNAFDYLMDLEELDFTVLPVEEALPLKFDRDETYANLDDDQPLEKMLADRWREQNPQDKTRVMWDLALVQAYLRPDLAEVLTVNAPPENKKFSVKIYARINAPEMEKEFYEVLRK